MPYRRRRRLFQRPPTRVLAAYTLVLALSLGAATWGALADRAPAGFQDGVAAADGSDVPLRPVEIDPAPTPTPTPAPEPSYTPAVAADRSPTCGSPKARTIAFRVLAEPETGVTAKQLRGGVEAVLCDVRSWISSGRVRFEYDPSARLVIALRTAASTERRCLRLIGLSVRRYYSCASSAEVVLNADRWMGGSDYWPGTVEEYRRLLVNHEVGHVLGHGHRGCSKKGAPAPVMMQQSKGTGGCTPNIWPLAYELRVTR